MGRRFLRKHKPGVVSPAYPTEYQAPYDGNPQKGMEGAALRGDGTPVNPAEAGKLTNKMAAERNQRIREQGHG